MEGIKSDKTASRWEFLWRGAKKIAKKAQNQRAVDVLHINPNGFRSKNYAHIHFCRVNQRGFQMKSKLKPLCNNAGSWEELGLAKCTQVSAIAQSPEKKCFQCCPAEVRKES